MNWQLRIYTQVADKPMRLAGSFGLSIAGYAFENERNRGIEIDAVSHGDEDWGCAGPSPQRGAYYLSAVNQRSPSADFVGHRFVRSNEEGLRDSHRRNVENQSKVAGKPKSAGMRESLSIAEDNIRPDFDSTPGFEQGGYLAK